MILNNKSSISNKVKKSNLHNLSLIFSILFIAFSILHFIDFSILNMHDSILVFAQTINDTSTSFLNNGKSLQGNNITGTHNVLSSWNDGPVKDRIITFVKNITDPNNPDSYIPPQDRIAVFDNDGTLWSEKPFPFQGFLL